MSMTPANTPTPTLHIEAHNRLPSEAAAIRTAVFVDEQGFTEEFDAIDERAVHLVGYLDKAPVATCRFFWDEGRGGYVVGRIAVVRDQRGRSLGAQILRAAEDAIAERGGQDVQLAAQVRAADFYRKQGYAAEGDEFLDEYCPHVWMRKELGRRYFRYGADATDYLARKDPKLGAAMELIGPVRRAVDPDLFTSVVNCIIGQQISTKAQATVCERVRTALGRVSAATVLEAGVEGLQPLGMTFRKAEYILDFARQVDSGTFDLDAVWYLPDDEAVARLSSLKGIGVWTAEMILLFCMERPDILSFGDLAIHRGMRMLYHHRAIDRKRFETYRRRYSPYGSVASLYLWAIAGGAIPGMRDYAPKGVGGKKRS